MRTSTQVADDVVFPNIKNVDDVDRKYSEHSLVKEVVKIRDKELADELKKILNDRACQDFITLKAEMEKLAEQLDGKANEQ